MTQTKRRWLLVGWLCLQPCWSMVSIPTAQASVLVRLSLADMTTRAGHVFQGRVEKLTSRFVPGHDGLIITEVQIRCLRSLRGVRQGEVLLVSHLGGVVGEKGQRVFGEASYQVGEEVVVLAEKRENRLYAVGMAQGKIHVDRTTGSSLVQVHIDGAELIDPTGKPTKPAALGIPLETLWAELSTLVQRHPSPSVWEERTTPNKVRQDLEKSGRRP